MRFKTKWKKLVGTILGMSIGMILLGTGRVEAALQANQTTHDKKQTRYGYGWFNDIRKMETTGNTMGLTEKLNSDLTSVESNSIDVHMMKTTEYGAIAILSASGYGNPKKLSEVAIKSSTGNKTGVYMGDRWEWTAGTNSASSAGNKDPRYYDLYTDISSAKAGDALGAATNSNPGCAVYSDRYADQIKFWHNDSFTNSMYWLRDLNPAFMRGGVGIFSFSGQNGGNGNGWTYSPNDLCARGVAVVGEGM